jgi:aspartyl-tRNA synthetase
MLERRTHTCGELREQHVGETVTLQGWAANVRDRGGVTFIVLRDRYGTVQVTLDERSPEEARVAAKSIALEYTVQVKGVVVARYKPNSDMATGAIEVVATHVEVLSATPPMPFPISEEVDAKEETRLKWRFLDLRRPPLQRNLILRHRATMAVRKYLDGLGFLEMETPILTKSTPEGARDFLVPSRVNPGQWFALPQSPQLFKQILMIAGYDRYFQIARCFRDEDLRADRQPEFTQIDVEMSFCTREMVMEAAEGIARAMWRDALDYEIPEIPRMSYHEAIDRFGLDAPDIRYGMELFGAAESLAGSTFAPVLAGLEAGGAVKGFVVAGGGEASRKQHDAWTQFVKAYGLGGLLFGRVTAEGITGTLSKAFTEGVDPGALLAASGAVEGDLIVLAAGKASAVNPGLGRLRVSIARERGLIVPGTFKFCWVIDFPMFELDPEGAWTPMHHPFTSPRPEHMEWMGTDKMGDILANAYDLVCNGSEIGGGSIRIHRGDIQQKVFTAIRLSEADQHSRFGFLLDALAHGAPPHGGLAFGLDRCIVILSGADSIRDVIAFPKTTSAQCLMTDAPGAVPESDLNLLRVRSTVQD